MWFGENELTRGAVSGSVYFQDNIQREPSSSPLIFDLKLYAFSEERISAASISVAS
jgi:hypothetical protein